MLIKNKLIKWINWSYVILFALLPFSLPTSFAAHQLILPSEPLIATLSIFLLIYFYHFGWWSVIFYRHPLTVCSLGFIVWMGICIPFSSQWQISMKYWIVAAAHWWVFYHGIGVMLFPKGTNGFLSLLKQYAVSFTLILLYAWYVHAHYDFRIDASVLAARPFYFDHAMYGAVTLLLLPFVFLFDASKRMDEIIPKHWFNMLWFALLLVGVYLSFSRAAWLSTIAAILLLLLVYFIGIQPKHLFLALITALAGVAFFLPQLSQQLSNNQAKSKTGTLWEQLLSSANTTTDASNLERLNRYSCAIRMTKDKPWIGFGPGTFQFAYLDYQKQEEMTRISVTSTGKHKPGRGGGAHSEYLQAFAETGVVGGLLWLGVIISMLWVGLKNYRVQQQKITLALLFGLTTFFIHAFFNNFLHHGKVAALVWSSLALLCLLDRGKMSE
ncbi:MAG: O-antigen ligase family protein [Bacteroidota bacterium]